MERLDFNDLKAEAPVCRDLYKHAYDSLQHHDVVLIRRGLSKESPLIGFLTAHVTTEHTLDQTNRL